MSPPVVNAYYSDTKNHISKSFRSNTLVHAILNTYFTCIMSRNNLTVPTNFVNITILYGYFNLHFSFSSWHSSTTFLAARQTRVSLKLTCSCFYRMLLWYPAASLCCNLLIKPLVQL